MPDGFNPCRLCGSPPEIVSGFSRKSDSVRCTGAGCINKIDVDYTVKECRNRWNSANPSTTTPVRQEKTL